MLRAAGLCLIVVCAGLVGCDARNSSNATRKPAGTMHDPVEVCERAADVCRIDKAKLGVCTQRRDGAGFACASQH